MKDIYGELWKRRKFLGLSAMSLGALLPSRAATAKDSCEITPSTEDGPLYPAVDIPWADDLTVVPGVEGVARGQSVYLYGEVSSFDCRPITDATVEIWQADDKGYYNHPRHSAPDGLDPSFRYFGKTRVDENGHYRFKTIVPSWYRIFDIDRAAHIHIKVRSRTNGVLTSEVYFSGEDQDSLRQSDPVFQSRRNKDKLVVVRNSDMHDPDAGSSIEDDAVSCRFDLMYRI